MKQYFVKITSVNHITHDVLQIVTEKPEEFNFIPGQATYISINEPDWKVKKSPFTFTSLPKENYLEFVIKTYPEHKGVTNEMLKLKVDDELILHDVFGSIAYKGEGVFIAGGAGITPYISIFRKLNTRNEIGKNKLIFANKMKSDIILKNEFEDMLGRNFVNILADEKLEEYSHGLITEGFLEEYVNNFTKHVYVCGPPSMMEAILKQLSNLGVAKNTIIVETF